MTNRSQLWHLIDRISGVAMLLAALAILIVVVERHMSGLASAANTATPSLPRGVVTIDGVQTTLPLSERDTKATVALIEFSDFECPFCRYFALVTYPELKQEFFADGQVLHVFKHLPNAAAHPHAFKAALAAECARRFGKFPEVHKRFFDRQNALSEPELLMHSAAVGVDSGELRKCIDARATADVVDGDIKEAFRLGASATPTFFLGRIEPNRTTVSLSRRIEGAQPYPIFRDLLRQLLVAGTRR
jgi:protein-disulfide isomerase